MGKRAIMMITKGKPVVDDFGNINKGLLPPDFKLNTDYEVMKIAKTENLRIDLPSETIGGVGVPETKTYSETYLHNLNFVPQYEPLVNSQFLFQPTGEIDTNSLSQGLPPIAFGGNPSGELISVYVTTTGLTLEVQRYTTGIAAYDATAYTAYVDFTLYNNRVDLEVDYRKYVRYFN